MSLKEKVQALIEKAKVCNMTLNWLKSYLFGELYDFENLYGFDLFDMPFRFSQYERTILDNYTTKVIRTMNIKGNSDLLGVVMPCVEEVQTRGFYACEGMTECELGRLTSTHSSSFQGCTALKHFKIKPETTADIYLQNSNELTVESLQGIIDNYADMTGAETAPLLYIGEANISKLSEEYIQKLIDKGITYK